MALCINHATSQLHLIETCVVFLTVSELWGHLAILHVVLKPLNCDLCLDCGLCSSCRLFVFVPRWGICEGQLLGLVVVVVWLVFFLTKENQLPKVIKDLLSAKFKSLNICCERPWGRDSGCKEGQSSWEEVTLNRLFHHGAVLSKQQAISAIFRKTVWHRKYKQMTYNIKQRNPTSVPFWEPLYFSII